MDGSQVKGASFGRPGLVAVLLVASIASLLMMWFGGLVPYKRGSISATEMQNLYLSRMARFGLLSGALQALAILLVVVPGRPSVSAQNMAEQRHPPKSPTVR